MTDPYHIYNALIDLMCSHCNQTIRRKCKGQDEDKRCKCMIVCMKKILVRNDEEYPVNVPKV